MGRANARTYVTDRGLQAMSPPAWYQTVLPTMALLLASSPTPAQGRPIAATYERERPPVEMPASPARLGLVQGDRATESSRIVPSVVGLLRDSAAQRVRAAGFRPLVSVMPGPTGSNGQVITQRPAAGVRLTRGRSVAIVVSDAPTAYAAAQSVRMPSVIGRSAGEARAALASTSTDILIVERRTSVEGEAERVLSQEPSEGTIVPTGVEVLLAVGKAESLFDSAGARRRVLVPSVGGLSPGAARERLRAAQLGLGAVRPGTTLADSTILTQRPDSGTTVESGTLVEVTLAAPPTERGHVPWWMAVALLVIAAAFGAYVRLTPTVPYTPRSGESHRLDTGEVALPVLTRRLHPEGDEWPPGPASALLPGAPSAHRDGDRQEDGHSDGQGDGQSDKRSPSTEIQAIGNDPD